MNNIQLTYCNSVQVWPSATSAASVRREHRDTHRHWTPIQFSLTAIIDSSVINYNTATPTVHPTDVIKLKPFTKLYKPIQRAELAKSEKSQRHVLYNCGGWVRSAVDSWPLCAVFRRRLSVVTPATNTQWQFVSLSALTKTFSTPNGNSQPCPPLAMTLIIAKGV